ncbi:hypothetical protein Syun_007503 [Stephania yunnanensis]|uniref:Membrane-associated kinase regulator 1 n=1 Tax=Stephania yunnanensis TaxID=152371 RepID=A0AAP0L0B8_9MAGN
MGRRRRIRENEVTISSSSSSSSQLQQSQTLPSSPTHSLSSSSSSDFEFRISSSPNNCNKSSSSHVDIDLCPADDLFYKGQLLPLHLSPRLSMVRTLLLASSSSTTSSSSPRDSTGSSNDSTTSSSVYGYGDGDLVLLPDGRHQYCDSSRQSSVTDDDQVVKSYVVKTYNNCEQKKYSNKYFTSLAKFSSVFRRDHHHHNKIKVQDRSNCSVKRVSASAKEVIRKYLNKVKPFCDKLSNHHKQEEKIEMKTTTRATSTTTTMEKRSGTPILNTSGGSGGVDHVRFSHSFSGNIMMYPQRRRCVSSCPSSMRSSPSHSQCSILHRNVNSSNSSSAAVKESLSSWRVINGGITSNSSSMEELQSAIQGAIAHCKNSMIQKNNGSVISKEI